MIERCFWTETTDRFVPRPDELPERTDVAIVGGGYTGVAAARALGRHGANVTVLERETVGWGASTRNGGFVLPGFKLGAEELLVRFGPDRARALFQQARDSVLFLESVIAEEGIACDYARCGHLSAAAKPSHFRAMEHDRRVLAGEFGHQTEIISPAELHTELGSDRFHGGLLDPFAGSVHPRSEERRVGKECRL